MKTDAGREQREAILDFCAAAKRQNGYFPTQEEIQMGLELSRGSFLWHLDSLVSQGFVSYDRGRFARTLKIGRRRREFLE